MAKIERVLIVGGGIAGMTLAIALAQKGVPSEIVEAQRDWTVYGVGIIQPSNALRALDSIGLAQACLDAGGGFPGWRMCAADGTVFAEVPNRNVAREGFPAINGIARPHLHRILQEGVADAGVPVRLGLTVQTLQDEGKAVSVTFTDGSRRDYDLVVGADGAHSAMRRLMFGPRLEPQFTGEAVWRYNLPRPTSMAWGSLWYGRDCKAGLVPMSPSDMYLLLVTPEPANLKRPKDGLAAQLRERLSGFGGLIAELRDLIMDDEGVVYRPMESVLVPAPWRMGRICLIGDAAHCTTPHLAQGAALAIEDAVLLAELAAADIQLDELFETFMARRFTRAETVVSASLQLGEWEKMEWAGVPDPNEHAAKCFHDATEAMMAPC